MEPHDDVLIGDPLDEAEGMSRRRLMFLAGGLAGAAAIGLSALPADAATKKPPALPPVIGTVYFPTLRLARTLYNSVTTNVLNKGQLGLWTGTSVPSPNPGHSIIFGHRTSAGGPLRNLNKLRAGYPVVVDGMTYTTIGWEVVKATNVQHIFTSPMPDRSVVTFVACSKTNGMPTSLLYRILVQTYL
jgi:sortase (surface protein transpeptidase)